MAMYITDYTSICLSLLWSRRQLLVVVAIQLSLFLPVATELSVYKVRAGGCCPDYVAGYTAAAGGYSSCAL